ncbi:transmembrane amino acid transporter protein [Anaeramoeba flamelloides]|uniref:Transmembrane amino acid transporter protein n=1 Tax=Anaeramoeba flamelloides TaxID=1746091 RepID=A0AAV7YR62_9EUKA|nr:transmembrane amino acid transporter protein [Anaeramoeba flamelloides]
MTDRSLSSSHTSDYELDGPINESVPLVDQKKNLLVTKSDMYRKGKASLPSSISNITNTVLGAGILSLPYVLQNMGWALGFILMGFIALISIVTLKMLGIACKTFQVPSYPKLMRVVGGKKLEFATKLLLLLTVLSAVASYIILIGDCFPKVIQYAAGKNEGYFWTGRNFITVVVILCVAFPVSMLPKMDYLRYTSYFSIFSSCYVVFLTVFKYAYSSSPRTSDSTHAFASNWKDILKTLPNIIFAYGAQIVLPSVTWELKNPTKKRVLGVGISCVSISSALYACSSLFGYLKFGAGTKGDILNNYPVDDTATIVGRMMIGFVGLFSYPVVFFVGRESFKELFFTGKSFNWLSHTLITFIGCVFCTIIALTIPQIQLVTAFCGGAFCSIINFAFPALAYLHTIPKDKSWVHKIFPYVIFVFGLISCVGTSIIIVWQAVA